MSQRKPPEKAVWVECPGVTNEGKAAHSMRDNCWSCAPYWEKYPTCPIHGQMILTTKTNNKIAWCHKCRKHYDISEETK